MRLAGYTIDLFEALLIVAIAVALLWIQSRTLPTHLPIPVPSTLSSVESHAPLYKIRTQVDLRQLPDPTSRSLVTLSSGLRVRLIRFQGGWAEVTVLWGWVSGWLKADLLERPGSKAGRPQ